MTAPVIILPVVARPNFHDPDWREQTARETRAMWDMQNRRPPATRPLLVVSNAAPDDAMACALIHFECAMRDLRASFCDDVDPRSR
jgi:hypothetical protein